MLQQEGLVEAEPNQRASVASWSVEQQDGIWAQRIVLETLAARIGAARLTADDVRELSRKCSLMRAAWRARDDEAFGVAHREFHALAGKGAGREINDLIVSLADKTKRFLAVRGKGVPHSAAAALADHQRIVETLKSADEDAAAHATAVHIGIPAMTHLHEVDASFEPVAVVLALRVLGLSPKGEVVRAVLMAQREDLAGLGGEVPSVPQLG